MLDMRILVTGAFGWTAISIVETLSSAGHQITAFDLPSVVCPDSVKQAASRILFGAVHRALCIRNKKSQ